MGREHLLRFSMVLPESIIALSTNYKRAFPMLSLSMQFKRNK